MDKETAGRGTAVFNSPAMPTCDRKVDGLGFGAWSCRRDVSPRLKTNLPHLSMRIAGYLRGSSGSPARLIGQTTVPPTDFPGTDYGRDQVRMP